MFGLECGGNETFRDVKPGLELQSDLENFASTAVKIFDEEFKIRIGNHFGEDILGMLGCRGTKRLGVIGEC